MSKQIEKTYAVVAQGNPNWDDVQPGALIFAGDKLIRVTAIRTTNIQTGPVASLGYEYADDEGGSRHGGDWILVDAVTAGWDDGEEVDGFAADRVIDTEHMAA